MRHVALSASGADLYFKCFAELISFLLLLLSLIEVTLVLDIKRKELCNVFHSCALILIYTLVKPINLWLTDRSVGLTRKHILEEIGDKCVLIYNLHIISGLLNAKHEKKTCELP